MSVSGSSKPRTESAVESDNTIAWSALLAEATERIGAQDARRIVEEVTGALPGGLHSVLDDLATERGVARFDSMVARRDAGEPLQYVLGRWGFRTLDLMVDHRVLIPRPETETVAGLAIEHLAERSRTIDRELLVADLGTGSGAIALSIAVECPATRVMATDASPDALAVARANLAGIGRAATRVSLHEGSWFDAVPSAVEGSLDLIVSNPPYVGDDEDLPAVVHDWEPTTALRAGADGLADLRHIIDLAPGWLTADGALVLEMAPDQTDIVAGWAADEGLTPTVHRDLAGRPRAVVAHKKGSH